MFLVIPSKWARISRGCVLVILSGSSGDPWKSPENPWGIPGDTQGISRDALGTRMGSPGVLGEPQGISKESLGTPKPWDTVNVGRGSLGISEDQEGISRGSLGIPRGSLGFPGYTHVPTSNSLFGDLSLSIS